MNTGLENLQKNTGLEDLKKSTGLANVQKTGTDYVKKNTSIKNEKITTCTKCIKCERYWHIKTGTKN